MSADRVARSVALEQAYVYDVYEQLNDSCSCNKCGSKPWPKVQEFLDSLEAGSIVCDVGSGNGKYLNVNAAIYTIGGDKSTKLCEITRNNKNNEIILLDNLSLPYRDESLDGVLSIAVIHHFATTERRVCALRELARVLRIGGRIIISVWAMEQNSRRFESQDVLVPVPWSQQHNRCNTPTPPRGPFALAADRYHCSMMLDVGSTGECYNYSSRKSLATNKKVQSHNNNTSTSPSSSNLSSPNETCYSFVRKAIQKLASGRPSSNGRRPWFLDSWGNCAKDIKVTAASCETRYDPDGCDCCEMLDVQDLPIELRRVDDDDATNELQKQRRLTLPASHVRLPNNNNKSQSMSNMSTTITNDVSCCQKSTKRKLVKQKQSICQDDTEEALDQHTDLLNMRKQRPVVLKQRSLNEEQLVNSNARTLEKEKLKHHLHKQTSLNDDLIHQRHSTKDYFFSSNAAARKLHLIKAGFANKLRTSTTNIEKVTAGSFKNGFVRILQHWKPFDNTSTGQKDPIDDPTRNNEQRDCADGCESTRRLSKEDGSDSSKDSSLQSDTSVDSEDSFASVIYIPKSTTISPTLSPILTGSIIKQSSCPTSPRLRQIPLSVYSTLTKQMSTPKPNTNDQQVDFSNEQNLIGNTKAKYTVQQIPKFNKKTPNVFAKTSADDSNYPLIRQTSLYNNKPKLLTLELFNPETDDKDSDSSAVSSPDSIDSVISVQHKKKLNLPPILKTNTLKPERIQADVANNIKYLMKRTWFVPEPEPWNKDCQKHLTVFADRLTEKLQLELSRYQKQSASDQDPYIHRLSEELYDLSKLTAEIQKQNEYLAKLSVSDEGLVRDICRVCQKRKCQCSDTSKRISDKSLSSGNITTTTNNQISRLLDNTVAAKRSIESFDNSRNSADLPNITAIRQQSIESAEHSNSSDSANKYSAYSGSTASLASCPDWKVTQRDLLTTAQTASKVTSHCDASQESLQSDGGTMGGEITYHRFYHVFRERELDQLIEKYVENLHIISSYYDHASWCIVAEKVHVWTI